MYRFTLGEADRERYGAPGAYDFDMSRAVELPVEVLERVEDETGYTILRTLPPALDSGALKAIRAAVYLALLIAQVEVPPFKAFTPRLLDATAEWVEPTPDADPPAQNRAARRAAGRKGSTRSKTPTEPPSGT